MLVVTRLPPGPVCQVGYVDGRANPNALYLISSGGNDVVKTANELKYRNPDKLVVPVYAMPGNPDKKVIRVYKMPG